MSLRAALLLSLAVGVFGASLRLVVAVRPVDEPFRDVIRYYDAMERPAR